MPRPLGRPTRLTAVIGTDEKGQPVTVRDRILTWLRTGLPFDTSVLRAGISVGTAHHWLREASRAEERMLINPDKPLTDHEAELVEFNHEVEAARAEGEARYFLLLAQLAQGGVEMVTTTEREDAQGRVVERTTKTERTLPSERALFWILERRYPASYPKQALDVRVSGTDPLDEQDRAAELHSAIRDMLSSAAAAATEAEQPDPA